MGEGRGLWILLLQWEGTVWSRKLSLVSTVFIAGKGACVPLSELHREKVLRCNGPQMRGNGYSDSMIPSATGLKN